MEKTRSEILFERFLTKNLIPFRSIQVGPTRTPDYGVTISGIEIVFEVKEIVACHKWGDNVVHGGKVGGRIRQKINSSKGQMQAASMQGKPTVLLIFNDYDPLQIFGTDNHDFKNAMYGDYTLDIDVETLQIADYRHGRGKAFQECKNTSFSALGRLIGRERGTCGEVTLFENVHAAVPIEYAILPSCFEVIQFEIASYI